MCPKSVWFVQQLDECPTRYPRVSNKCQKCTLLSVSLLLRSIAFRIGSCTLIVRHCVTDTSFLLRKLQKMIQSPGSNTFNYPLLEQHTVKWYCIPSCSFLENCIDNSIFWVQYIQLSVVRIAVCEVVVLHPILLFCPPLPSTYSHTQRLSQLKSYAHRQSHIAKSNLHVVPLVQSCFLNISCFISLFSYIPVIFQHLLCRGIPCLVLITGLVKLGFKLCFISIWLDMA